MNVVYSVERLNDICLVLDTDTFVMSRHAFKDCNKYPMLDLGEFLDVGFKYVDDNKGLYVKGKKSCVVYYNNWIMDIDMNSDTVVINGNVLDIQTDNIKYMEVFYEMRNLVLKYYFDFSLVLTNDGLIRVNENYVLKANRCSVSRFRRMILL